MISIVMPTYSRGEHLRTTIETLASYMSERYPVYELILVFDGGTLETKDTVVDLCSKYEQIHGILLEKNLGQQQATIIGLEYAQYPYVFTIDDDLEHPLCGIELMLQKLQEGYDLVYGVSERSHRSTYRKLGTEIKELVFRWLLAKPQNIQLTSYKAMTKTLTDQVSNIRRERVYLSAELLKHKPNMTQVQLPSLASIDPKSGYTWQSMVKVLWYVFLEYGPIRLSNKRKDYQVRPQMEVWLP